MTIFVRCDKCGADFDGEKHHQRGFRSSEFETLMEEAGARGWTHACVEVENEARRKGDLRVFETIETDLCPSCSAAELVHATGVEPAKFRSENPIPLPPGEARRIDVIAEGAVVGQGPLCMCVWRGTEILNVHVDEMREGDRIATIGDVDDYIRRTGVDPLAT